MAGIPLTNAALYHRLRFSVGDPAVYLELPGQPQGQSLLILRDIEMQRARQHARADRVACPADFAPASGLSGDRETATAQAAAECLRRAGVARVVADRSLPMIYVEMLARAGIAVECDLDFGVIDRRRKDEQEIAWLSEAQAMTEAVVEMACSLIARAKPDRDGVLTHQDEPLTSERVRAIVDHRLLDCGYTNPPSIIAAGVMGGDCHELGRGPLRTGEPVIVDIFPRNSETRYNGDCTRTVVHGEISDEIARMHRAVRRAKAAAIAAVRAGVSGETVHRAAIETIRQEGFETGIDDQAPPTRCAMVHGTGHGVGLDIHEPPLLDFKGPELLAGDVVTVEPGLYRGDLGGIRVEDMVVVTAEGCENLNKLPEGLDWR
jgi:Xaa-Pro aminopeptidase